MNTDKLSIRLACVASYIQKDMRVADIGSDHAYLPCFLVKHGVAATAIAGEVADGPFLSAQNQVRTTGLTEYIDVRKGDGLDVLELGEVDCIVIAGMGGSLIEEILDQGKAKLTGVKRLILQPNIGAINIRKWLLGHGWELKDEQVIEEDGRIYEILVAEIGDPLHPYQQLEKELLMGPFLLKENNDAFRKKWMQEFSQWEVILDQINKAASKGESEARKQELLRKIELVKEIFV